MECVLEISDEIKSKLQSQSRGGNMSDFWLITNVFLDVFPWIFLLYMPFKDRLRFSRITTGVLNFIALTIYLLIIQKDNHGRFLQFGCYVFLSYGPNICGFDIGYFFSG